MKNDGVLPLTAQKKVLVVGELFENMRYQGAGSSQINATRLTTPKEAFDIRGVDYTYARGYSLDGKENPELLSEAVTLANDVDTVVVFLGLTDREESEGGDRFYYSFGGVSRERIRWVQISRFSRHACRLFLWSRTQLYNF